MCDINKIAPKPTKPLVVKSETTTLKRLNITLEELQSKGHKVSQIFPCPNEMDFKGDEVDGYKGNFGTSIVIIYVEGSE